MKKTATYNVMYLYNNHTNTLFLDNSLYLYLYLYCYNNSITLVITQVTAHAITTGGVYVSAA